MRYFVAVLALLLSGCVSSTDDPVSPAPSTRDTGSAEQRQLSVRFSKGSYDEGGAVQVGILLEGTHRQVGNYAIDIEYPFIAEPCSTDYGHVEFGGCEDYVTCRNGCDDCEVTFICGHPDRINGVRFVDHVGGQQFVEPGEGLATIASMNHEPFQVCDGTRNLLYFWLIRPVRRIGRGPNDQIITCSDHDVWDDINVDFTFGGDLSELGTVTLNMSLF